jgi:hypothetical protein
VSKLTQQSFPQAADPVYLAASAVASLRVVLPVGTAYFIGIVLITMMTGQLVHHQGSLARAALPYVLHLRWGWHRVERAMERGKVPLDQVFDQALDWCWAQLPVDPVRLGAQQRTIYAIDTSTIARLRATPQKCAWLGKGYWHQAHRAVRANIVAALTRVVCVGGVRVGVVRRPRFGTTCEKAVATLFTDPPQSTEKRLFSVDAGIATLEQFRAATEHDALCGRLRRKGSLRRAPLPSRLGRGRGRPLRHGPALHPGAKKPEGRPDEDLTIHVEDRDVRLRRWRNLHFKAAPLTRLDVVRVDDPAYHRPLLIGTTARELTTPEIRTAYGHRWPVETNFYVAQGTCAMEMPRAWTERAVERRISLALLAGSLLKAIAAARDPLPMGPWDRKPARSAGRLANYLGLHTAHFVTLALQEVAPRTYRKFRAPQTTADLQLSLAA